MFVVVGVAASIIAIWESTRQSVKLIITVQIQYEYAAAAAGRRIETSAPNPLYND